MNYLKELNAFREWLLANDLPAGAISLWHTLMSINNAARWKKRFNAPNGVVRQLSGLSKQSLLDAREKLKANNLITFEKGKRGQASVYEMISLTDSPATVSDEYPDKYASQSRDESGYPFQATSRDESISPSPAQSMGESRPVRKQKHKETQARRREDTSAGSLLTTYEQNIGKMTPVVQTELEKWTERLSVKVVLEAIKHVTKYSGQTFSYLEKVLETWREAGITTLEALETHEKANPPRAKNTVPFRRPKTDQSLFDELREEV